MSQVNQSLWLVKLGLTYDKHSVGLKMVLKLSLEVAQTWYNLLHLWSFLLNKFTINIKQKHSCCNWCVCRWRGHREPDKSESLRAEEPAPPHPQRERVWRGAQRSVGPPFALKLWISVSEFIVRVWLPLQSERETTESVRPSPSTTWETWAPPRARERASASWRAISRW